MDLPASIRDNYSVGCAAAASGNVFDIGSEVRIHFKYELVAHANAGPTSVASNLATLQGKMERFLRMKLMYCPGNGLPVNLSIDGIKVQLALSGTQDCLENLPCVLDGEMILYQRLGSAGTSALESIQAALAALKMGMDEHAFEDGVNFQKVGFLGGVIDSKATWTGRDTSVEGRDQIVASSNSSYGENFRAKTKSLSQYGDYFVAALVTTFLVLVVSRVRKRARKKRSNQDAASDHQLEKQENDAIEGFDDEVEDFTDEVAKRAGPDADSEALPSVIKTSLNGKNVTHASVAVSLRDVVCGFWDRGDSNRSNASFC